MSTTEKISGIQGITESDIANYLTHTPSFFERQAELLSSIQLTSPHGHRAVSLQERQMEMLREKIKGLEQKIIEMIRHGQENVTIADRLHRWTRSLMVTNDLLELPYVLVQELMHEFLIPQAAVRLWAVDEAFEDEPFAQEVSVDAQSFSSSLTLPYCGLNSGFEAALWLEDHASVTSVAFLPLRHESNPHSFGMLVLGSPDPTRFAADMGTEFLVRIADLASASLARLLPEFELA